MNRRRRHISGVDHTVAGRMASLVFVSKEDLQRNGSS